MYKQFLIYFLGAILFFGCKKEAQKTEEVVEKPQMSIAVAHKRNAVLNALSQEKIKAWKEYNSVSDFLTRFENISPSQALSNASEVKDLCKKLKDSIRIDDLKTPAFKSRLNVFENEVLRLADMNSIPAITPKEVNLQVDKLFLLFSSINEKINTVFTQKQFDKGIDMEDFFKLDSTEMSSTGESIEKKVRELKKEKK